MARKNAKDSGTIRKKTVTRSGKSYTYWEARVTTGRDPRTGKQIQRSFTGKTQKEVREKMQAAAVEVNQGTYATPQKMTVGQWLDIWQRDYLGAVKPSTVRNYRNSITNYIKPALGAVRLQELHPHAVQNFINGIDRVPATILLVYRHFHHALQKAVDLDYIPRNPADRCVLPKVEQEEIKPLDDQQVAALLAAAKDTPMEQLVTVALFTGLRMSELLGLTWEVVDFNFGTVTVNKQLAYYYANTVFQSPKSGKPRTITPAPAVMAALRRQKTKQLEAQLKAEPIWDNPHRLVFTNETGGPLSHSAAGKRFKELCAAAGLEGVRFHDMCHPYVKPKTHIFSKKKTFGLSTELQPESFLLKYYRECSSKVNND